MKLAYLSIKYIFSIKMHEITIKGLHTFHQKCKVHPSRPTNTRLDHAITKYKRNLASRSYVFSEKLPLVTYMKRNIVCTDMPSVFILAYCGLSTEPASGGMYNELFLLSGWSWSRDTILYRRAGSMLVQRRRYWTNIEPRLWSVACFFLSVIWGSGMLI